MKGKYNYVPVPTRPKCIFLLSTRLRVRTEVREFLGCFQRLVVRHFDSRYRGSVRDASELGIPSADDAGLRLFRRAARSPQNGGVRSAGLFHLGSTSVPERVTISLPTTGNLIFFKGVAIDPTCINIGRLERTLPT